MTHNHEQPPRNKHEMGTRPDEISVDALVKRIADQRANEGGKHAKRAYSFNDEYKKTLDALNKTVNENVPADKQFKDTMDAFDKTFAEYGISADDKNSNPIDESYNRELNAFDETFDKYGITPEETEPAAENAAENPDVAPAASLGSDDTEAVSPATENESSEDMSLEEYRKQVAAVTPEDFQAADKEVQDRWDAYYEQSDDDELASALEDVHDEAHETDKSHELSDDEIADIMEDVHGEALELAGANSSAESEQQESRLGRLKNAIFNRDRAQKRKAERCSFKQSFIDGYSKGRERGRNSRLNPVSFFGKIMGRINLMRGRNAETASDEELGNPDEQGLIRYGDGKSALLYQKKGYAMTLGADSKEKYARNLGTDGSVNDIAIIRTESGKLYGLTKGYLIDKSNGRSYDLPKEAIDLIIGKKVKLPGVGKLDKIQSVQLRYKDDLPDDFRTDMITSTDASPFTYFERAAADTKAQAEGQSNA